VRSEFTVAPLDFCNVSRRFVEFEAGAGLAPRASDAGIPTPRSVTHARAHAKGQPGQSGPGWVQLRASNTRSSQEVAFRFTARPQPGDSSLPCLPHVSGGRRVGNASKRCGHPHATRAVASRVPSGPVAPVLPAKVGPCSHSCHSECDGKLGGKAAGFFASRLWIWHPAELMSGPCQSDAVPQLPTVPCALC
jgi:hypothetical protein